MNKRLITGLIGLMSIALIGIVVVQWYWFQNSVKVRDELFTRSVNEAMAMTAKRMETGHDVQALNEFVFNDTIHWPMPDSIWVQKAKDGSRKVKAFRHAEVSRMDSDLTIELNDHDTGDRQEIHIRAQNGMLKKHEEMSLKRDSILTELERNVHIMNGDSIRVFLEDSVLARISEFEIKIEEKAEQLESLARKMIFEFRDARSIDDKKVRQILSEELLNREIGTAFQMAIYSDDSLLYQDENMKVELQDANCYSIELFPNDIFRKNMQLTAYFPEREAFVGKSVAWLMIISIVFTLCIVLVFGLSIYFILRQKRVSEMKSDFINNMTHEFKTPIATISVAADSIASDKVVGNPDKVAYFAGMIKKENLRMNDQVEKILQMARLERKEIDYHFTNVNVHELIEEAIESIALHVEKLGGEVLIDYQATNPVVTTDGVHFTNIVYNLLDNACKYSPEKPLIEVATHNTATGLVLSVTDHGQGMSKAVQSQIFDRFYRQSAGNVHNVKGFGLGLSYVKAVVEANHGSIKVHSEPGKGSRFEVFIPFSIF